MLSSEVEQRVRQHLGLARGLLETVRLQSVSPEFEERNASRAYYAVYHATSAWLLSAGIECDRSHGGLHDQVQRRLGKSFGHFVRDLYELRRNADYVPSWMPVRPVTLERLKETATNVFFLCREAEKVLSQ
jgi:uncharacterized protein (UPF0332 family)